MVNQLEMRLFFPRQNVVHRTDQGHTDKGYEDGVLPAVLLTFSIVALLLCIEIRKLNMHMHEKQCGTRQERTERVFAFREEDIS